MINTTRRRQWCRVGLSMALFLAGPSALAQDRDATTLADWLYLSPSYTWVQHSTVLHAFPAEVPLPIHQDDIQALWWDSHPADHQVQHLHGLTDRLLVPGAHVLLRTENGVQEGEVMQVLNTGLVIAVGRHALLLAPELYHQVSLPINGRQAGRLVFESSQETPANRTYAYRTGQITGQVHYRLDLRSDRPVLYQDLRIDNPSDQSYQAQGLSYHPAAEGDQSFMRQRGLAMEVMSDSASPTEGVSGQQAVLTWRQAVTLEAHSSQWVRVQHTPLDDVSHEYRWRWHGQSVVAEPSQWTVRVSSDATLPRLPGPVDVSWFDEAAAMLNSQYRSAEGQHAVLALGNNAQVTLTAEATDQSNIWQLRLNNRLEQNAQVALELHHPRSHQVNVLPHLEKMELDPGTTELRVQFTDRGTEVRR